MPVPSTTNGLGSTAARSSRVPDELPVGVCGLHPVGPWLMPKEIVPPDTAT